MMKRTLRSALAASCLLTLATSSFAEDWTRFRGPNGTGLSEAKDIPVSWGDKDYNWRTDFPGIGHSQPVVWGERRVLRKPANIHNDPRSIGPAEPAGQPSRQVDNPLQVSDRGLAVVGVGGTEVQNMVTFEEFGSVDDQVAIDHLLEEGALVYAQILVAEMKLQQVKV